MPSSLQALMTRTAISPRLAMRIFLNRTDGKQRLPVLHRLAVHHQLAFDDAGGFASISFISFMDSMMQSTLPGCTRSPRRTNGGAPGDGAS